MHFCDTARLCEGAVVRFPKSAMAVSKVFPVALSIVRLKFGTTGKPRRRIWISPSASRFQYSVTGDNGKLFFGMPGNCFFIGRSISMTNRLGSAFNTICGSASWPPSRLWTLYLKTKPVGCQWPASRTTGVRCQRQNFVRDGWQIGRPLCGKV